MKLLQLNILHTEWSDGWGGQEIRILTEAMLLRDKHIPVSIATRKRSVLYRKANENGIPTHAVPFHKGIALNSLLKIILLIRSKDINVIHSHSSVDARIAGIAAKLKKIVHIRSRHLSTPLKNDIATRFLYLRLTDHIITSGESIRQMMISRNKYPSSHITSIPAGADPQHFSEKPKSDDLLKKLGLSKSDFIVGIVAVLRSWKGHSYLFDAISEISNENPNVKLLVLGDGPLRENLHSLILQKNLKSTIHMLGHIDSAILPEYYALMDIVVLSSTANEATSQTLPQAMLMRKAVIGTDIGSIPEVVINSKTGLLIEAKSATAIANAILELKKSPTLLRKLAENGQAHALKRFTLSGMIENTIKIYHNNLDNK